MALRIHFAYASRSKIGFSVRRLSDGRDYDWKYEDFKVKPVVPVAMLTEQSEYFPGLYEGIILGSVTGKPDVFPDGDYLIRVHLPYEGYQVIGVAYRTMVGGDDLYATPAVPAPGLPDSPS